jgi:CobQ-like glutamine amidotransferase family enzyme
MEIKICHLYPQLLNQGGDRGNISCLRSRLLWRGIDALVIELPLGEKADFSSFDLFYMGGGEDFEKALLLGDLHTLGKASEIKAAIEDGAVFLAVCGGYQILGNYRTDAHGQQWDFLAAINTHTSDSPRRMTGGQMFKCEANSGGSTVVGFENHIGRTYLGDGVRPLGEVLAGWGNNGEDKTEGARYNNVFATYNQGPILPKNPEFADLIIKTALARRHPDYILPPLDDTLERCAHEYMTKKLTGR